MEMDILIYILDSGDQCRRVMDGRYFQSRLYVIFRSKGGIMAFSAPCRQENACWVL